MVHRPPDRPLVIAKPLWACIEVLLATTVIIAGLTLEIRAFMFGSAPWLAAGATDEVTPGESDEAATLARTTNG